MTSIFIIAAVLTAATTLALIRPLMRAPARHAGHADHANNASDAAQKDLALYRRQLAELDSERNAGRLDDTAYESARVEIARRMLAADKLQQQKSPPVHEHNNHVPGYAIMVLLPLMAIGLYLFLGNPHLPGQPYAARNPGGAAAERDALLSQKPMVEAIINNPDSVKSLMIMGLAAQEQGDYATAARAFARALEHEPDKLMLNGMLGHALVQSADGKVTGEAMEQFNIVLEKQPDNALGLYYRALKWAQDGDVAKALDTWRDIISQSPEGAPWNSLVQNAIDKWTEPNAAAPR